MKITVCELSNHWTRNPEEKDALTAHLETTGSEFLLLPEMPFHTWLAGNPTPDPGKWQAAVEAHDAWLENLAALKAPMVAGTRPILKDGTPHNQGFVWTRQTGAIGMHEKYYLPDEEGFWEATWYRRGDGVFEVGRYNGLTLGFLICTELWFNARAREYGKNGMELLLCPRATPAASTGTWLAGGRAAANVSGAFCLSSNFNGPNTHRLDFGGTGWIVEPEEGNVLGTTSASAPFLTLDIDPDQARQAKTTYPRYVKD